MAKLCESWSESSCRFEEVTLERLRDFFRVKGKATNLMNCTLPHLQLRLSILDSRGRVLADDIFHIIDRKLEPKGACEFKAEGEWKLGMSKVKVTVRPYPFVEEK